MIFETPATTSSNVKGRAPGPGPGYPAAGNHAQRIAIAAAQARPGLHDRSDAEALKALKRRRATLDRRMTILLSRAVLLRLGFDAPGKADPGERPNARLFKLGKPVTVGRGLFGGWRQAFRERQVSRDLLRIAHERVAVYKAVAELEDRSGFYAVDEDGVRPVAPLEPAVEPGPRPIRFGPEGFFASTPGERVVPASFAPAVDEAITRAGKGADARKRAEKPSCPPNRKTRQGSPETGRKSR